MRCEYCNEYHFMIGENYKPACVKVAQSEVHKVGNVCYIQYSVLSIATKAAHRKQIRHSCQSLGELNVLPHQVIYSYNLQITKKPKHCTG